MADIGNRDWFRASLAAASLERGAGKLGMQGTSTQAIAAEIGCDVHAVAWPHVFRAEGRAVVAVMSGDRAPDRGKLSIAAGSEVGDPDQAFLRAIAQWTIHGRPPSETVTPIDVFIDADLFELDEVWIILGSPRSTSPAEPARLRDACDATVADLKGA